jgi:hypothetical protein
VEGDEESKEEDRSEFTEMLRLLATATISETQSTLDYEIQRFQC